MRTRVKCPTCHADASRAGKEPVTVRLDTETWLCFNCGSEFRLARPEEQSRRSLSDTRLLRRLPSDAFVG